MTAADEPPSIAWLTDWDVALAASQHSRRPVLIDVSKDP